MHKQILKSSYTPARVPLAVIPTLILFLSISQITHALDREEEDAFCKSKLAGTVSQETCVADCPGGAVDCVVVQTHKAEYNPTLDEDVKCYGCSSEQTCYDLGLIYGFPDCITCEMNPFKKCVKSIPIPIIGGSIGLSKDSNGYQCWDCVDDPDTCWRYWPGASEKPACEAVCTKKNHKCVKAGVNPDNGYNCYQCKDLTPPKTCQDKGLIYKAQCVSCPPARPRCEPALSFGWFGAPVTDAKGEQCYGCSPKAKSCNEQGLKSKCAADEICNPKLAPNGAKCCDCVKKPKTCADYGMKNPPCACQANEILVKRMVNAAERKKIECCDCQPNPCHPDLNESDCKECEAKGGKCEPITRVRGAVQCYRCVMPPPEPQSCEELRMPTSCSPDPCYTGFTCEMADMGGFECAECIPNDSMPPNLCENHLTHKFPNCAVCFNAQMSCDQIKVSDNPLLYCANCLPPIDQRCPDGMIEGYCATPWCVDGLKCVDTVRNCHLCIPNEECAPGRFRAPDCDNQCAQDTEECRRIEGCEFGYAQDSSDLAIIDQMNPEDKYCGPDITGILLTSLNRIKRRASNLTDDEKGAIDGTMFLDKNGMSIDLRAASIDNSAGNQVCPSRPCMAGTMKSAMICGKCVMDHIGNDILFGFVSNQLDVPFSIQLAGAHYAEYTSYGGLDPLASQAAYVMGNNASERMNSDSNVTLEELCDVFNNSTLETGIITDSNGFDIMTEEQPFLKDCKPCLFTETKVLKDFSESSWKLEDGSHDNYTPPRGNPEYCCYGCFPKPTDYIQPPMSSATGTLGFNQTDDLIFTDGFESGDTSAWSSTTPKTSTLKTPTRVDEPIFADGFESGDTSTWSTAEPSSDPSTSTDVAPGDTRPTLRLPDGRVMRVDRIERTFVVIIIETPFGIVVLGKKDPPKLNAIAGFKVSSVMALARADSPAATQVKAMMRSIGADPTTALGTTVTTSSLKDQLTNGMNDKKNKYADNCFDDFQKLNLTKLVPTSSSELDKKRSAKNKKKGIEGGPRTEGPQEFGVDPEGVMTIDGPIIACGKSGKKKALMVFDRSGNPIAKILPSTLKDNSNAIMDALHVAQGSNRNIQAFKQGGAMGPVNNFRKKAKSKVTKTIQDVEYDKKGDPKTAFSPNDQFFKYTKKKKKKFLGIIGGSAPKLIGGRMNIGGGGIQIGASAKKRKAEYHDQWGIQRVGYLPKEDSHSAWNIADGNEKNVIVAVIDSGIDFTHPDLPQYIWVNPDEIADNGIDDDGNGLIDDVHGWNFVAHNNDLTDKRGHGTHVAGIIAAKRNNSIGIAGINPGAIIMPIKVTNDDGESNSLAVYQGIHYAVNQGAQVINISLGGRGISAMIQSAMNHAHAMGVFVAVASGNTGEYLGHISPASVNHAFTVSAIDHDGAWSTISSVGPNVALLAPGEEIVSLRSIDSFHKRAIKDPIKRQYFRQSGTSFSTPIVAATASLMLAKNPRLTPQQIEDILLNTATDMGVEGWDGQHGAGLLNATEALKAVDQTGFLTVKLDRIEKNLNKKKRTESVDIYATVRGPLKNFTVGIGKGKRATKFKQMAGPFTKNAEHAWVAHIGKDNLRGSDEWVVQIEAADKDGNVKTAQTLLELK